MPDYLKDKGYPDNPRTARLFRNFQAESNGNGEPVFAYQSLPQQSWLEVVEEQKRVILKSRRRPVGSGGRRDRMRHRLKRVYRAMGLFARMEHGGKD